MKSNFSLARNRTGAYFNIADGARYSIQIDKVAEPCPKLNRAIDAAFAAFWKAYNDTDKSDSLLPVVEK